MTFERTAAAEQLEREVRSMGAPNAAVVEVIAMPPRGDFGTAESPNPHQEAQAVYERGDHATALNIWRLLSEQGDARAQNNLGVMYECGLGVKQDSAQAVKCFRLAAEQDHPRGQCNLGFSYENGMGVERDFVQALKWYWLSADQGDFVARANLGLMYCHGKGVERDKTRGLMWLNLAAAQGDRAAIHYRSQLLGHMAPAEIDRADRLAQEWKPGGEPVAADSGWLDGGISAFQRGDYAVAVSFLIPVAARGNLAAQVMLGRMYADGLGAEKDMVEAANYYRLAAEQGDMASQTELGLMYLEGVGVEKNNAEGVRLLSIAAETGSERAQWALGLAYELGLSPDKDHAAATRYYRLAAEQGNSAAQVKLGHIYSKNSGMLRRRIWRIISGGNSVTGELVQAHMWFSLAAAQGNREAIDSRDELLDRMTSDQIMQAERLAKEWKPKAEP